MGDEKVIRSDLFTEAAMQVERVKAARVIYDWLVDGTGNFTDDAIRNSSTSVLQALVSGDLYFGVDWNRDSSAMKIYRRTVRIRNPRDMTQYNLPTAVALVVKRGVGLVALDSLGYGTIKELADIVAEIKRDWDRASRLNVPPNYMRPNILIGGDKQFIPNDPLLVRFPEL